MKRSSVELKSVGQLPQTVLEFHRRNAILSGVAAVHVALLVMFVTGIFLDPRTIGGDPVWLKPSTLFRRRLLIQWSPLILLPDQHGNRLKNGILDQRLDQLTARQRPINNLLRKSEPSKFAASIALFTATLGWLSYHLPVPDSTLRRVSIGVAAAAFIEILLISGQAACGVEWHFNDITILNTVIYLVMGVTILAMTLLVAWLLIQSWHQAFDVAPAFEWGIRFGIALFILGALEGGVMVILGDNTIGSGPAIPVLGWILSGDFRVAHFLGLHTLQVLPLAGYLITIEADYGWIQRPLRVVMVIATGYAVILFLTFAHAFAPIIG